MGTNGSSLILTGALQPLTRRPVVGNVRARVAHPLNVPPTLSGPYGRAWRCDLDEARAKMGPLAREGDAMVAHWIVEAPWSHEVIHSSSLVLIHLRFSSGHPVTRYIPDATHEFALWAIHPAAPRAEMLTGPANLTMWLTPPVFGAQIAESSDKAAEERVRRAAEFVCKGKLSPHADHARSWAELFGDNMLKHAQAPAEEGETS